MPSSTIGIDSEQALADFRRSLTAEHALDLIQQAGGKLLITLPVGVGKTLWMESTIRHVAAGQTPYDAVLVLVPRKDTLAEIRTRLFPEVDATVIRARPRQRCGSLDSFWRDFETHQCSQLARQELCGICLRRRDCSWPKQYGQALRGKRVVLATQQHLARDPHFIARIGSYLGASRLLTLVDESDILLASRQRLITPVQITQFLAIQRRLTTHATVGEEATAWARAVRTLQRASVADLQGRDWNPPPQTHTWAIATQRCGREHYGTGFDFLGYDLASFGRSDPASRRLRQDGSIRFSTPAILGSDFIIYSGSIATPLARYRTDPDHEGCPVLSPFSHYQFSHPDTRWFNICWAGGAARYFAGNSPQILDFFAAKIARNIREGKRTLLVARKSLVALCAAHLTERLRQLGFSQSQVITAGWDSIDLSIPTTVPLINYGVSGINRFEDFDAAYCLTGFYVNAQAIVSALDDLDPIEGGWNVAIRAGARGGKRIATVANAEARGTFLPAIAQCILDQLEADRILQAVGRVRPFTRHREVITFHAGALPGVCFTAEFNSLDPIRACFQIGSRQNTLRDRLADEVGRLRANNIPLTQIAATLGISPRTVSRHIPPLSS